MAVVTLRTGLQDQVRLGGESSFHGRSEGQGFASTSPNCSAWSAVCRSSPPGSGSCRGANRPPAFAVSPSAYGRRTSTAASRLRCEAVSSWGWLSW
eukprot:scaffold530422_cov39-Prasinocladus_malaysianus.AAC.1